MENYTKILNYLEEHTEEFNELIEELDSYNGYLGDDKIYPMEELSELFSGCDPIELLQRAFYGYDDAYRDENGNHTESFNPNREYFYFNGYANLVSCYEKDYSDHLDEWFIKAVIENQNYLNISSDLQELIDELESTEEE